MNRFFKAVFESIFSALSTVGLLALVTPALLGEDSTPPYSQLVLTFFSLSVGLVLYRSFFIYKSFIVNKNSVPPEQ